MYIHICMLLCFVYSQFKKDLNDLVNVKFDGVIINGCFNDDAQDTLITSMIGRELGLCFHTYRDVNPNDNIAYTHNIKFSKCDVNTTAPSSHSPFIVS
jgi:hypothetical protein